MADALACLCGKPMVQRQRRADGHRFWGCSTYPACAHTVSGGPIVDCPNCGTRAPVDGDCSGCGPGNPYATFEDDPDPAGYSC